MPKWTAEQQQVIDTRDKSLLVAAGAGSGKTAVLVERIIQMICDTNRPVQIDSLLVVTFTNAAASEMKERIGAAIQKALLENPTSQHLYQQSLLLQKAQITTLHSFCLDLVRQNFFRLEIDPNLKIADETENQLLLRETLDELLEQYYSDAENNPSFIKLAQCHGGKEDEQLRAVILRLYQMAESMAEPEVWLKDKIACDSVDWFQAAQQDILQTIQSAKNLLRNAIQIAGTDDGLYGYLTHMEQEYNWICELQECFLPVDNQDKDSWNTCALRIQEEGFTRLPSVKKNTCDEELKEQVKENRDKAKACIQKLKKDYFNRSKTELEKEMKEQLPFRQLICDLTIALIALFQQKKMQKGIMDFHDMEHFCYSLLYEKQSDGTIAYSELALELQAQYTEILVDEYQDINDLQEAILQAVSRPDNLFMVGDIKQSIYGFRMANPNLFAHKYYDYPQQSDCARIDLNRNFRCRTNVVDGVNQVFAQIMTGDNGDLLYDQAAALIYGADYPPVLSNSKPIPEQIHFRVLTAVDLSEETDSFDDHAIEDSAEPQEQPLSSIEAEGMAICKEIQNLIEESAQVYDKHLQAYRDITWRDIVILLRSPKAAGTVYAQILNKQGIPAAVDAGDGYFAAWEIQIVVSMLHIIDNPLQDIPLMAVLKAPFFSFTDDELAVLRMLKQKQYFYDCLVFASESDTVDPSLQRKAAAFLEKFQQWRTLSMQVTLSQLIWQLYKDTGFYEYAGTLRDGLQRQANLRALHERAIAYEQTSFKGVFMFLRFLEQLEENQADLEPAKILSDNDNVIRIMSIHKSKGLEFPVVFIGGMGRKFNMKDLQQDFLLDKDYGIAFSAVDAELEIRYKTVGQHVISRKKRIEALQEEKRVLYVAMTRARERLYLIGSCSKPEKRVSVHPEQASAYLDWLIPLIHQGVLSAPLWEIQYQDINEVANHLMCEAADLNALQEFLQQGESPAIKGVWYEQIDEQLSWSYENPCFTHMKAQSSVTELKKMSNAKNQHTIPKFHFDSRPEAVKAKTALTGAEKGTLLHLILSRVDLKSEITEAYLHTFLDYLEEEQYIPYGAAAEISLDGILAFFQSPLGQRLIAAEPESRYRELPFITALDAHVIDSSLPAHEKSVLVQGIIDCLWKESDGWVLVDYKSDQIQPHQTQIIYERYTSQIQMYRYAVEKILGEPVKEAYFYLTSVGTALKVL